MGLSTTISTAFFTLILISGAAYVVTMNIDLMTSTSEPLGEYLEIKEDTYRHECVVDSWNNQTGNSIDLNVTNTGEEGIRITELGELDILVTYTLASGSRTKWLEFDQDVPSSDHWAITQVFTKGGLGDVVNRINLSGDLYGIWDPDETLEIRIFVSSGVLSFDHVKIGMPFGSVSNLVIR